MLSLLQRFKTRATHLPDSHIPSMAAAEAVTLSKHLQLPAELVNLIIDELRYDKRSLSSCSRVCRSWLPRSSVHIFHTFSISCSPNNASAFLPLIPSSARVLSSIRELVVTLTPANITVMTTILERLPRLKTLWLLSLDEWSDTSLPMVLPAGRTVNFVQFSLFPVDVASYFLDLFASVDTLEVRSADSPVRSFEPSMHRVKHLDIELESDGTLVDIGSLVDPAALESVKLDMCSSDSYHARQASAELVDRFLQSIGRNIKHFEYAQPKGGWLTRPSGTQSSCRWLLLNIAYVRTASAIPGLAKCGRLESITVTTPKTYYSSFQALWLETLVILSSLPPQTKRVKLITGCEHFSVFDTGSSLFLEGMKGLAWDEFCKALEHCESLNVLEIAACNSREPIYLAKQQKAQEAILEQLPLRLRKITSFL